MTAPLRPSHRYQFVRFYDPDGQAFVALTEVYLNDVGDVWAVLPDFASFAGLTEADVIEEMQLAFDECRAHPVFDTATLPAEPPTNLTDEFDRTQALINYQPTSATRH
jgi:hypothetical protein